MRIKSNRRQSAEARGFRSGLELEINEALKIHGINGEYEKHTIKYIIPESNHKYTPDFKLPNGIFVESKGRFILDDQKKHLLIKQQNPEMDIRFVFQNSRCKLRKGSKTTYADWCIKHGFLYADKTIPTTWL